MTDDSDADKPGARPATGPVRLQPLPGGGGPPPSEPQVRLLREFKGLTVSDLLVDSQLVEQLPGRVRSAAEHLARGDLAAAEQAMPGRFAEVIPGPGHRDERAHRRWLVWIAIAAVLVASAAAFLLAQD